MRKKASECCCLGQWQLCFAAPLGMVEFVNDDQKTFCLGRQVITADMGISRNRNNFGSPSSIKLARLHLAAARSWRANNSCSTWPPEEWVGWCNLPCKCTDLFPPKLNCSETDLKILITQQLLIVTVCLIEELTHLFVIRQPSWIFNAPKIKCCWMRWSKLVLG